MDASTVRPNGPATLSLDAASVWPVAALSYDPVLDDHTDISRALSDLTGSLARESELSSIRLRRQSEKGRIKEQPDCRTLNCRQLSAVLQSRLKDDCVFEMYAISRHLRKKGQPLPADHRMLQISLPSFKSLASQLELPARYITAIPRHFQVCSTGMRKIKPSAWEYWCLVPVRVTILCHVDDDEHAKSTAGSNQMDPFHYIHLGGAKVDIRGSHVAIYMRHDASTGRSVVVVTSLMDGRWGNIVEEPLARVKETLGKTGSVDGLEGPLFVLLIYISAILQWWNNVLWCFHKQLVLHEKSLQEVIANMTSAFSNSNKDINKALHSMAAHLHRYNSELNRLHYIIDEILQGQVYEMEERKDSEEYVRLVQLLSKSSVIRNFCEELERKVQNILTLLFNQIQATNDRTLQAILIAAQDDTSVSRQVAIQSHELTRSMKRDSIAMKTIAVMTMVFLPGTSFAALLSMPFFDNAYFSNPDKIWIWVALTIPSTAAAFWVYWSMTKRNAREYARSRIQNGAAATQGLNGAGIPLIVV